MTRRREPGAVFHGEKQPGHHFRRAIDAPVRRLVAGKVIVGQRLGQSIRLMESQPQSLAGERVDGAGRVADQEQRARAQPYGECAKPKSRQDLS